MKIKLSKFQWKEIGQKAGWTNKSYTTSSLIDAYHGSRTKDINEFRAGKTLESDDKKYNFPVFYFTSSVDNAKQYGPYIHKRTLDIKNPMIVNMKDIKINEIADKDDARAMTAFHNKQHPSDSVDLSGMSCLPGHGFSVIGDILIKKAYASGHDGIIFLNLNNSTLYVVFDPSLIAPNDVKTYEEEIA